MKKVKSKMKVVCCNKFEYTKVEKCVIFMSEFWHESIYAKEGTVKFFLFYEDNYELKRLWLQKKTVKRIWELKRKIIEDNTKSTKVQAIFFI